MGQNAEKQIADLGKETKPNLISTSGATLLERQQWAGMSKEDIQSSLTADGG